MKSPHLAHTCRRNFFKNLSLGAAVFTTPGLFAELLTLTPSATEGPFYPDRLPLDTDNDLLILNDKITPATGIITHLTGQVTDPKGNPISNAVVEIWQADNHGVYLHSGSANKPNQDTNFQGFGRFLTNRKGEYYFRTIRPVPYPGRSPHIHVIVKKGEKRLLTSQLYVKEESDRNKKDFLYNRIQDPKARENVTVAFTPIADSPIGELAAHFHIIVGTTPEDV